jgi:branched-chain amino acid transport system substrate-binding protein
MTKKSKRLVALFLAAVMIVAVFAGCAKKPDTDTTKESGTGAAVSFKGEIVIGSTGPLTGGAASYGTSVKNGAQIAVDEINAAGGVNGYKLVYYFEDDEATGDKAKAAYDKLMDKGMQIFLGAVTSGASISLNDAIKEDGILQLTPSASQLEAVSVNDNAFRICFTDPIQGQAMAEYAYNTLKYTKAALLFNQDDSYSTGVKDAFKAKFKELGGKISVETSFTDDAKDFNAQLTQIASSDAEVIFMPIYNDKVAQIALAADAKGVKLPMLGSDGWDGVLGKYLKTDAEKKLVEGAIFLTPFFASDSDPRIQKFVSAYTAAYNAEPDQFAADGYDGIYIIKAALEKINATDKFKNEDLVAAMVGLEVDGLTGKMKFDKDGEPNKSAKLAKIENGTYVSVKVD